MAANNGMNRDRLIATFMSRTRRNRKPTPGDRTAGLPRAGQGENARFARSESNYPNPGAFFIPGYSDVKASKDAIKVAQAKAQYDGVSNRIKDQSDPAGRQRAPYRGKRRRPRVSPRNAGNPGPRPTLN